MSSDKFDQWCVVEVMGHKKFAGRVTEGPFGMVQVDVPEVTLTSGKNLPAFSKLFGSSSIYCLTPCTEETARAFARDFRTQAFQTYELPALTAPKPTLFTPERDPEWDQDTSYCEDCGASLNAIEDVYCKACQDEREEASDVLQDTLSSNPVNVIDTLIDDGEPF